MATRIAGAFLLFGCIILLVTTVDFVSTVATFTGGDDAPIADRLAWSKSVYDRMAAGWMIEVIAIGLIAAAGLSFLSRASRTGWALAAVGALVTAPQYAMLRGGRGGVFESDEINAELFITVSRMASEAFYIGQGLMMFGFACVFVLEILNPARVLPRWALGFGGVFGTLSGTFFVMMHTNLIDSWMLAGLTGLVTLAATSVLALALIWKGEAEIA
ncbi:MAG: hypothetical protein AAFN91_10915 [Pseudomonadota bacterium]